MWQQWWMRQLNLLSLLVMRAARLVLLALAGVERLSLPLQRSKPLLLLTL